MNEDKSLKDLLQRGLMETASPGFTDKVMSQLQAITANKASHSSLIAKRCKLLYKIAFVALSVAVIIMSFLIKPVQVNIQWLIDGRIIEEIVLFIISFWIFIFLNHFIIDKKIRKPFM